MAWNDTPPTKEELGSSPAKRWDATPPTKEELGGNQNISQAQSLGSGLVEGMAGGFSDELGGAGKALMDTITGITPVSDTLENYRRQRDLLRQDFKTNAAANPKTALLGNLIGSAAIPMGALEGTSSVGKGLALGGAAGLGGSEADLTKGDAGQALSDTASGAALGGITGPVLEKLLGTISPEKLLAFANRRSLNQTGIKGAAYKKLVQGGNAEDVGQRLHDMGITGAFKSPEEILEAAQNAKQEAGQNIGENLKTLDQPGVTPENPNPQNLIEKLQEQRQPGLLNNQGDPYKTTSTNNTQLNNIVDDINSHGLNNVSFEEAQRLKMMLKKAAYDANGNIINDEANAAYGIVNKEIENAAEKKADVIGIPGLKNEYVNNKKNYSSADIAERASTGKVASDAVNKDISLTDYIAGGAGALTHGNPGMIAGALANKAARTYGNGILGGVARGASQIFSMPKQGLQTVANGLMSQGETGQKLGNLLMQAAERDDVGKNALLFSLMQQPQYRELLKTHLGTNPGEEGSSSSGNGGFSGGQ